MPFTSAPEKNFMNTPAFETLREVITNQLGIEKTRIREHTPFKPLYDECEASSIELIDIALALEEAFQIELHIDDFMKWKNPQDAVAFLEAAPKVAAQAPMIPSQEGTPFAVNKDAVPL